MTQYLSRTGIVFVMSGPSGAGKSTICSSILKEDDNLKFSVSCTTRSPRRGERDGEDYYFITEDMFRHRVDSGDFLEYAIVHGDHYGTLRPEIERSVDSENDILMDIDVQGVAQIKNNKENRELLRSLRFILIAPPSHEELERRLRSRGTESEEKISRRLEAARNELSHWRNFDFIVINSNIKDSIKKVQSIIQAERLRASIVTTANPWS